MAGGDIEKDGFDDIIVGAGPGSPGGHVKVFSGRTQANFILFDSNDDLAPANGVYVAASPMAAPDPRARAIPQN